MSVVEDKNPFRQGVGTAPLFLAARDAPLRSFRSMLRAAHEIPANMRLTGLRGVGKTVLLGEFVKAARVDGWESVLLELQPGHNSEDALVRVLSTRLERTSEALSRV